MALIKGNATSGAAKRSIAKSLERGVPCERNLTTGQRADQKHYKGMKPEDVYNDPHFAMVRRTRAYP
jgi:hypothetical protein